MGRASGGAIARQQRREDLAEGGQLEARGVAGAREAHGVEHAGAAQLAGDLRRVVGVGLLVAVGVDAAHEVAARRADARHERAELQLELGALRARAAARRRGGLKLGALLAEERAQQRLGRRGHQLTEAARERVEVALQKALAVVAHLACVVPQHKLARRTRHARRAEARVRLVPRGQRAAEAAVGAALTQQALLLEQREYALRALDEEHRLGVVDVLERPPRDALLRVLGLLLLEDHPREELLQLLVGVVDAELLEAVGLEALEAEDVQAADAPLTLEEAGRHAAAARAAALRATPRDGRAARLRGARRGRGQHIEGRIRPVVGARLCLRLRLCVGLCVGRLLLRRRRRDLLLHRRRHLGRTRAARRCRRCRRRRRGVRAERAVDAAHHVVEEPAVERLGEAIERLRRRGGRDRDRDDLAARLDAARAQRRAERLRRAAQQRARACERGGAAALGDGTAVALRAQLHVTQVEQRAEQPQQLPLVRGRDAHSHHRLQCFCQPQPVGAATATATAATTTTATAAAAAAGHRVARLREVGVLRRGEQLQLRALLLVGPLEQLVEDVVVALALALPHHAALLEQVGAHLRGRGRGR